jgi:hypothetical protein
VSGDDAASSEGRGRGQRGLAGKVARKLTDPQDLRSFLRYRLGYGNEYLYMDLVDRLPLVGRLVHGVCPTRVDLDRPILLAGLRRSGTTLFYRIMHAHPDLFLYNERFPGDRLNRHRVDESARHWNNIWTLEEPDEFRAAVRRYIGPNVRFGYRRWGVKLAMEVHDRNSGSPDAEAMRLLFRCMPGASVVGIVRDPRDFVLSATKRAGHDIDWWISDYNLMADLFCELRETYRDRFRLVRYEDLVTAPREIVARCCEFAELEFHPAMLQPESWSAKGPREYARGGIVAQTEKWRQAEGHERAMVAQVERACFPRAAALGYAAARDA